MDGLRCVCLFEPCSDCFYEAAFTARSGFETGNAEVCSVTKISGSWSLLELIWWILVIKLSLAKVAGSTVDRRRFRIILEIKHR